MAEAQLVAKVSTTGAARAESDLKKVSNTAKKTESNVIRMEGAFKSVGKNASAAIASIDGPLGSVSGRVSSLTTLLTSGTAVATGFGVAISAIGASVISGTLELDEYNVALRRTEQLLKATGNASGFTAQELRGQADVLALATLTSTQEVQRAQAALLTFNKVSTDVFEDAIRLSQDLAESGFGNISSNAIQLGKALNDPITGLSALTRVGISFTNSEKDMVKTLVEANQTLEAQRIIIQALENQVGGAGAAVAVDTLAGSWDTFTDVLGKFNAKGAETLGVTAAINSVLDQTSKDIQAVTDALDKNSRASFNALIQQRQELQSELEALGDVGELPVFGSLFGPSQADAALLQDELKAVESEIQRIQDVEKKRQQEITAAREAGAVKQKELAEKTAADQLRVEEEKNRKIFEKNQEFALQELERINALNDSELEAISRKETALIEQLISFQDQKLINEQQFQDALTEVITNAATKRSDIETAEAKKVADEKAKIDQQRKDAEEKAADAQIDALGNVTSNLKSTLGEQSGIYKAAAVTQATIDTYKAANAAFSALAGIPVVGPALGAAAAGVAIGTGLANVQQITSARRQGGGLAAGQSSTIAENNELEVITPASASRVRTKQQMQQLMGEGGGTGGGDFNLTVIDQSSGQKEFAGETNDRGEFILLIKDVVSQDLQTPNTKIAKARKNTRNQPGF